MWKCMLAVVRASSSANGAVVSSMHALSMARLYHTPPGLLLVHLFGLLCILSASLFTSEANGQRG